MSGGRKALVQFLRDARTELDQAGGFRASQYDHGPGHFHGIGANGLDYGCHNWHLGYAAGVDWAMRQIEKLLMDGGANE